MSITRRQLLAAAACAAVITAVPAIAKEPAKEKESSKEPESETPSSKDLTEWSYGGVTVAYPSEWKVIEPEKDTEPNPRNLQLETGEKISVTVSVGDEDAISMSSKDSMEFVAALMAAALIQTDGFEDVSVGKFEVVEDPKGVFSCTIPFDAEANGWKAVAAMHLAASGPSSVSIIAVAPEDKWDEMSEEFANVFSSVRFEDAEGTETEGGEKASAANL